MCLCPCPDLPVYACVVLCSLHKLGAEPFELRYAIGREVTVTPPQPLHLGRKRAVAPTVTSTQLLEPLYSHHKTRAVIQQSPVLVLMCVCAFLCVVWCGVVAWGGLVSPRLTEGKTAHIPHIPHTSTSPMHVERPVNALPSLIVPLSLLCAMLI